MGTSLPRSWSMESDALIEPTDRTGVHGWRTAFSVANCNQQDYSLLWQFDALEGSAIGICPAGKVTVRSGNPEPGVGCA